MDTNNRTGLRQRYLAWRRRERGAVLVEAALAIPILLLVTFGAIEAGFAFEAKSAGTSGVRTAVLRQSAMGSDEATDLRSLQSVIGEVGAENVAGLDWVIVFKADVTDIPARVNSCAAAIAGGGLAETCVVYDQTTLQGVLNGTTDLSEFDSGENGAGGTYTCDITKLDANWCAPSRTLDGDIPIGVAIHYNHTWFTGILPGGGVTIRDFAVSVTFTEDSSAGTPGGAVPVPIPGGGVPPTIPRPAGGLNVLRVDG